MSQGMGEERRGRAAEGGRSSSHYLFHSQENGKEMKGKVGGDGETQAGPKARGEGWHVLIQAAPAPAGSQGRRGVPHSPGP